ncbi:hypothetical protein Dimus_030628 [Dionaea muscipula]
MAKSSVWCGDDFEVDSGERAVADSNQPGSRRDLNRSDGGFTNTSYTGLSELYSKYKDQVVVKQAIVKKSAQVAKIPNPRAAAAEAAENIEEAAAKAQNGGECKCEVAAANVIIISTETSNGRAVKERSRKKKTGGGPIFTSLLTARSKEAVAIGGVVRKQEDLIIVNIDEASGDDELAVAEYAEDIYKFNKLIGIMINFFSLFYKQKFTLSTSK